MSGATSRMGASLFVNQAGSQRPLLIPKDRECRAHAPEAELLIEALRARLRVQDDLRVSRRQLLQLVDDRAAQAAALCIRMDRDVANIRTVGAIGQSAARAHELALVV